MCVCGTLIHRSEYSHVRRSGRTSERRADGEADDGGAEDGRVEDGGAEDGKDSMIRRLRALASSSKMATEAVGRCIGL